MNADTLQYRPFLNQLEPYTPGEQLAGENIIKLNTNENPYPPAPAVIEAVAARAGRLQLYPNPTSEPLRRALTDYHRLPSPDWVLAGNGSDEILRLLIHAFIGPGGRLAMADPTYSLYSVLAETFEGSARAYPLDENERLTDAFFAAPEPLLLLPNPNPPIGTLFSLDQIARLCEERPDRLTVIDEAYVDFAPRSAVALLQSHGNLAVTRTFSKSFSLAGMRIGYLLARPEIVTQLNKIKDSYNLSALAQAAAEAAIASSDYMRHNAKAIVDERNKVALELESIGYRVPESHGNFLFPIHAEARAHFLALRQRNILVRYFDRPGLDDGMRVTIGTPKQMRALLDALHEINAK